MLNFRSFATLAAVAAIAITTTGCAVTAPQYGASYVNTTTLRDGGAAPVAVGEFTVDSTLQGAETIALRGNPMTSPVGKNYAEYLADALRAELASARRHDPKSTVQITGSLRKNVMDASGLSTGEGAIEAQFIVKRDGQVRYDKVKKATVAWPSSFVGASAIPAAMRSYPVLVQNLLATLYADGDFLAAIR